MLTIEEAELNRQDRMNEVGTMPACPLCGRPRVERSDYVRCNLCGVNWLNGEDLTKNPKIERYNKMVEEQKVAMSATGSRRQGTENSASTAKSISESK